MKQPLKASLRDICDNLARQNKEQHQALLEAFLQLGIYQTTSGPLPQSCIDDVIREMNANPSPAATANEFLRDVRAVALRLSARALENAPAAPAPIQQSESRSAYMSRSGAPDSQSSLPDMSSAQPSKLLPLLSIP